MNNILNLFRKNKDINEIITKAKGLNGSLFCGGMTENISTLLTSAIYNSCKTDRYVIYVCSNLYKANIMYDKLTDVLGLDNVNLFVVDDFVATEAIVINNELKQERLNTLLSITEKKPKVIVTHITALAKPLLSYERFTKSIIKLNKGEEINIQDIIQKLTYLGYTRTSTTYTRGQYSVRGEVLDIFPSCSNSPIRVNFSFDEIEQIKSFDPQTQRTIKDSKLLESFIIFPMNEMIIDFDLNGLMDKLVNLDKDNDYLRNDCVEITETGAYDKLFKYIKYIDGNYGSVLNYLYMNNLEYITIYDDLEKIDSAYETSIYESYEFFSTRAFTKKIDLLTYLDLNEVKALSQNVLYFTSGSKKLPNLELIGLYNLNGYKVTFFNNDMRIFVKTMVETNNLVYLTFRNTKTLEIVKENLKQENVSFAIKDDFYEKCEEKINLILCDNAIGYGLSGKYEVITEDEIFKKGKVSQAKYRSVTENTTLITSKEDLQVGDYIVHYDYGIGKYLGIKTVNLKGTINDYLDLQYGNMNLLVPVEKVTDLEKFLGAEGVVPHLTKIGTNEWERKKNAVREELVNIAKNLIDLQVKRSSMQGHVYEKDSDLQKEFENDFEYEETRDQLTIVKEIKEEMEKGVLIDRLVCGDVGFGKTEIALRIAFKTVYEGKQVAVMAPTTILTRQHYLTFTSRCEKYGIKVALLNRLVPEKEQRKIINDLKKGSIDIVIGTHRLLSAEINYKDLGLLIVDEEQRFGVAHKEKIKQLKDNINVITLTATPIPRTLQMAVTGIRELSLLETPPKDRYPIQTYVFEASDSIIREAIFRELSRNGQVFFLHNRISDLMTVAKKIKKLVPEAKVCVGHGRMEKEELEDVVSSFIDGKYNVFVCTTIIETGIDIPNSNTLIVDDASRLGLAQMYQIRGRVGRSDRIAYAYFMYTPGKELTRNTSKRLDAIKEYSQIGSGYKIAVRDLAIRGAGDILGKEQSGFINSIGIDMYMKLLNEAVNKAKGIEEEPKKNYRIDVSKHVEREYVSDDTIIIYIHQQINKIDSLKDKENTIKELTDRFGKLSDNILLYVEERYLESLLRKMNVKNFKEEDVYVSITIPEEFSKKISGEKLMMNGYKISKRFRFEYREKQIIIIVHKEKGSKDWINLSTRLLETLV